VIVCFVEGHKVSESSIRSGYAGKTNPNDVIYDLKVTVHDGVIRSIATKRDISKIGAGSTEGGAIEPIDKIGKASIFALLSSLVKEHVTKHVTTEFDQPVLACFDLPLPFDLPGGTQSPLCTGLVGLDGACISTFMGLLHNPHVPKCLRL